MFISFIRSLIILNNNKNNTNGGTQYNQNRIKSLFGKRKAEKWKKINPDGNNKNYKMGQIDRMLIYKPS